jgi:4-hydroxybenzoyl-CoA reductase subunit beta
MRLPAFDYLEPSTIEEAVGLLTVHPGAEVVAGGTDLFPNMKRRQVSPATVIALGAIDGLGGIEIANDGAVEIGALTLLRDLAASSDVPAALTAAAANIASPQIRNVATVGGNLCLDTRCGYINQTESWRLASGLCLKAEGDVCWIAPKGGKCVAVSSSDLAPAVVALDAEVNLIGPDGSRSLAASDLFRPDGIDYLGKAEDEIVTTLTIPPRSGWRTTYRKLRRRGSIDFPILGVAAAVKVSDDGEVEDARIVLGAIAPSPIRMRDAEEVLVGSRLGADVIERAAEIAAKPVRPYDNVDLGSRYRKWMAPVFVTRALDDLK